MDESETSAALPHEPDGVDGPETERERLNRNWNELLQELRVIQAGTQIITGFLLAAVFQSRFEDLDRFQLTVYLALVITSILTTLTGLAPVSLHRYLFRTQSKDRVVVITDRFAQAAMVGVAVTVTGIGLLIFDFALGRIWGILAAGSILLLVSVLWVLVPRLTLAAEHKADAHTADDS